MSHPIIYRFEAILNYPTIEGKVNQTGEAYQHFSSKLIVDKENGTKLKHLLKEGKKAFPNAKQTVHDLDENEKEILGDNFIKTIQCSTRFDWIKIQDLYGAELMSTLKSGDKVYIQVLVKPSNYQGKSFLKLRPQLITLIKPEAYKLFDAQKALEKKNEEYFNDIKKYQQDDSLQIDKEDAVESADDEDDDWS